MATIKKQRLRQSWETATEDKGMWAQDPEYIKKLKSKRWQKFRLSIIAREPLCRECKKKGVIRQMNVLDHIKPVRLGGEFIDEDNVQPLCHSCHNTKSAKERKR